MKRLINKILLKNKKYFYNYLKKHCLFFGKQVAIYDFRKIIIDIDSLHYISIGDNVVITSGVTILAHDESYANVANVYGRYLRPQKETKIGNNVFIGMNSIILPGANIGDNVIIGAGSVVSGYLEADCVYGGNPVKKICNLDEYYHKLEEGFENSAYVYINGFYNRYKRFPVNDELRAYRLLFENGGELKTESNKSSETVSKANKNPNNRKYKNIEHFLGSKLN